MGRPVRIPIIIRLYAAATLPYGGAMSGSAKRIIMKTTKPSDGVVRMCAS
jgi:hypothetical protein